MLLLVAWLSLCILLLVAWLSRWIWMLVAWLSVWMWKPGWTSFFFCCSTEVTIALGVFYVEQLAVEICALFLS